LDPSSLCDGVRVCSDRNHSERDRMPETAQIAAFLTFGKGFRLGGAGSGTEDKGMSVEIMRPAGRLAVRLASQDRPASGRWKKTQAELRSLAGKAIADYEMIGDGDRVMVCVSGGKDSWTMLDLLLSLQRRAPVQFSLVAVNLDQKQPGFPSQVIPKYLAGLGVEYRVVEEDTWSIVRRVIPEGKTTCGLCSRLRRGVLYRVAEELGATRIALGHHRDDIVETLFLNMFYGGRMQAMPPKLRSDDGRHVVIRPLAYCAEKDIARYARQREFPIIPCNLCGSQENLRRQEIKAMLAEWERQDPGRTDRLFRSLQNVSVSHLADTGLYPFREIGAAPTG